MTIAFGDGRTLERTITGNSIHYVLDQDGRVVDALPGLYSAQVFAMALRRAADVVKETHEKRLRDYAEYQRFARSELLSAWAADLSQLQSALPAGTTLSEDNLEAPSKLVSTEKFLVPYVLEGEVRTYNQRMLERLEIRSLMLFFCVEAGTADWRFFDWRSRHTGPVDHGLLVSLMKPLF